jgi:hypothetical protein
MESELQKVIFRDFDSNRILILYVSKKGKVEKAEVLEASPTKRKLMKNPNVIYGFSCHFLSSLREIGKSRRK